jgi:hypothetical protein
VTDVFAFDQSRLTRSVQEWAALVELCRPNGGRPGYVNVHLVNGGTKDFASADGRMTAEILASIAAAERERAVERAVDSIARRRLAHDRLGPPAYGIVFTRKDGEVIGAEDDPAAVVSCFAHAGSYNGAARLLNARGIPPKRGGVWRSLAVRRVIEREAPGMIPPNGRPGARTVQHWLLAGLLRCPAPCGGILTASRRTGKKAVVYRCQRAWTDPAHPRPASIAEARLLPWIMEEVAHLRVPGDVLQLAERTGDRARLTEDRRRLGLAFARQAIDEPTWTAEDDAIRAQLDTLGAADRMAEIPPAVDWTKPPEKVNAVLRALWQYVELGPDLRPIRAEWFDEDWRS